MSALPLDDYSVSLHERDLQTLIRVHLEDGIGTDTLTALCPTWTLLVRAAERGALNAAVWKLLHILRDDPPRTQAPRHQLLTVMLTLHRDYMIETCFAKWVPGCNGIQKV